MRFIHSLRWDISGWKNMGLRGGIKKCRVFDGETHDLDLEEEYDHNGNLLTYKSRGCNYRLERDYSGHVSVYLDDKYALKQYRRWNSDFEVIQVSSYCNLLTYYLDGRPKYGEFDQCGYFGDGENQFYEYYYNAEGQLVKEKVYDIERDMVPYVNQIRAVEHDLDLVQETNFEYDEGLLTVYEISSILGHGRYTFAYEFNSGGNWTRMCCIDERRRIVDSWNRELITF